MIVYEITVGLLVFTVIIYAVLLLINELSKDGLYGVWRRWKRRNIKK